MREEFNSLDPCHCLCYILKMIKGAAQRKHYLLHKEDYIKRNQANKAKMREYLDSKKEAPCMDCGKSFPPCVMDFDHRDPSTKKYRVSQLLLYGKRIVDEEIAKCDLICSNCHRIRTHMRS